MTTADRHGRARARPDLIGLTRCGRTGAAEVAAWSANGRFRPASPDHNADAGGLLSHLGQLQPRRTPRDRRPCAAARSPSTTETTQRAVHRPGCPRSRHGSLPARPITRVAGATVRSVRGDGGTPWPQRGVLFWTLSPRPCIHDIHHRPRAPGRWAAGTRTCRIATAVPAVHRLPAEVTVVLLVFVLAVVATPRGALGAGVGGIAPSTLATGRIPLG